MNEIDPDADDVTNRIIGAAFEVSNILGAGFLEVVYRKALAKELKLRGLDARQEVPFRVVYKGDEVGTYFADLIVENQVVVELKALEVLSPSHVGQVLNYLRASGLKVGLLFNFGRPKVEFRRVLL